MKSNTRNAWRLIASWSLIFIVSLACSFGTQPQNNDPNPDEGNPPPVSGGNQVQPTAAPDDLMEMIFWGGWGGGGAESGGDACVDGYPHMWIDAHIPGDLTPGNPNHYNNVDSPYYYSSADDGVIGMEFWVGGCNLSPGDYVDIEITLPDNSVEYYPLWVDDNGYWNLEWVSVPGDQFGVYTVTASTYFGDFLEYFTIESYAPAPFIRGFCNSSLGENAIMLAGFQPNEEVLMARYESSQELWDRVQQENPDQGFDVVGELVEHWHVTADSNGTAITWASGIHDVIVAVGSESPGYTQYSHVDDSTMEVTTIWYSNCQDTPPEFLPVHP
jgi:hypothetical protein